MPSGRKFVPAFCALAILPALLAQPQEPKPVASSSIEMSALVEADELYRKGSFDQALAKYNEFVKTDPRSVRAISGIARSYLKQQKVSDAAGTIDKALASDPSSAELKVIRGEILYRQGNIADSERVFVEVINSGANNARAYLGLARVSSAAAMYARENRVIQRAHELDPSDPDIQKAWMFELPATERLQYLEDYLGSPKNDDERTARWLKEYLDHLKARMNAPHARCRLTSAVDATETDLVPMLSDPRHMRGFGLPVAINGQKSKLLLDTGAGGITINRKLAARAGLQWVSDIHIGGIGDKPDVGGFVSYADTIRIGNLEFHDCPVEVIDRTSVVDEEGLIGADVFGKFLIDLDFHKGRCG